MHPMFLVYLVISALQMFFWWWWWWWCPDYYRHPNFWHFLSIYRTLSHGV